MIFGRHDANTLAQFRDVSSRAVRAALMADGHVGYVMPIGGVAAYRGRVSVVGVGFDIACIGQGEPVTCSDGYWIPIEHVTPRDPVRCVEGGVGRTVTRHIGAVSRGVRRLSQVSLSNGDHVRVTCDHQLLTPTGWTRADRLSSGDTVAVHPFLGLRHDPFVLDGLEPGKTAALLRILGYVSGDGHLSEDGRRVSAWTTSPDDARDLAGDFAALGCTPRLATRARGSNPPEHHVYVGSPELNDLLATLGSPRGRKAWPEAPMPWLFGAPAWVRAHFLSAFGSAEATTPRFHRNGVVPNLQIKQAGANDHAARFIAGLLGSLAFETSVAPSGPAYGGRQVRVVQVLGGEAEQLRYWREVGFCRAVEKRRAAAAAASVVWTRQARQQHRERAKAPARLRYAAGDRWCAIRDEVAAEFSVSPDFVRHAIYSNRGACRQLPGGAPTPDVSGEVAWVPVASVAPAGEGRVFDVVTSDPAQCFVAGGVVVHNCGNAAIRTDLHVGALGGSHRRAHIADAIFDAVSFGIGRKNLSDDAPVDHPLFEDPSWDAVPPSHRHELREKARGQLGTVGAGNHYVDVFADEDDAVWVGVHFGSRGFGHTVASAFIALSQGLRWGQRGKEVEVLLPVEEALGHDYWQLMTLAGRYAYAGREWVARKVASLLGGRELELVHNHHNFCWVEEVEGPEGPEPLNVIRKGATPAFPGQKGFVGGSMGDDAVILRGTESADEEVRALQREALHSTVHGAGRVLSRTAAKGRVRKGKVLRAPAVDEAEMRRWLERKGVVLRGGDLDEAPQAYRRLDDVLEAQGPTVEVLHRLRPLVVCMAPGDTFDPYRD